MDNGDGSGMHKHRQQSLKAAAEAAGVDFLRAMAMATTTTMAMVTYDQFSGADSMVVEWDELDVDLLKPDILLDCGISFVVHHIQVQDDAAGC